jgi:uncharacterized protein YbaP (TraB family)
MKVTRLYLKLFLTVVTAVFIFSAANAGAADKAFIWKVKSGSSTAYVLGSIHAMKQDVYPLDGRIEAAFRDSTALAFEIDLNIDFSKTLAMMTASAMYREGDSLRNHMSHSGYEVLSAELTRSGLNIMLFDRCKPWVVAMTVEIFELARMGYSTELGIDKYFYNRAGGRRVSALETLEYQVGLFDRFSDDEQEAFLLATIRSLRQLEREISTIVGYWKSGEADKLDALLSESIAKSPELAGIYERILYRRNMDMALRIEDYLRSGERYFVVVGAAHLVGSKGILQILRGRGYQVRQM